MATTDKAENKAPAPAAERPVIYFHSEPPTPQRPKKIVGLVEEFGPAEGAAKYFAIARLEGQFKHPVTGEMVTGRYFFDPVEEGPGYRPPLTIATLPPAVRAKVAEIINTPQVEE